MPIIDLKNSYKTNCKFCGLVKKSSIPGNFVCKKCEIFCEQQLSGEELRKRNDEGAEWLRPCSFMLTENEDLFLYNAWIIAVSETEFISNQQYLSVCRILKRK